MRHVTLRQLRTFTIALGSGRYAAAAEALHITPPAVSVQMRQLEVLAGMPIAHRGKQGLVSTDAGRELALAAQRVDAALTACVEALGALRGLDTGRVSVGVVSTAKYFAPQVLAAFRRLVAIDVVGLPVTRHLVHHQPGQEEAYAVRGCLARVHDQPGPCVFAELSADNGGPCDFARTAKPRRPRLRVHSPGPERLS